MKGKVPEQPDDIRSNNAEADSTFVKIFQKMIPQVKFQDHMTLQFLKSTTNKF